MVYRYVEGPEARRMISLFLSEEKKDRAMSWKTRPPFSSGSREIIHPTLNNVSGSINRGNYVTLKMK